MDRRSILCSLGMGAAAFLVWQSGVAAQTGAQTGQKPAKDLIAGKWTLMIADNVRSDGTRVPGFGPLPKGTAEFRPDGHYTMEVMPNTATTPALKSSGSYTLDNAGKTLTLKVEDSSVANWKGTTQNGTIKFLNNDHLGWDDSAPLSASAGFTGAEFIWARAK
jgi:hypothetical protein